MGVEAGAPNQGAIDFRLAEKRFGILRLHTPAVQDAQRIGERSPNHPRHLAADDQVGFGSDGRRRRLSRPDRPDGLIGDDHPVQLAGIDLMDRSADLAAQDFFRHAVFPLFLVLTNANDRHQMVLERSHQLLVHRLVGLTKVLAALGMAKDHVTDPQGDQHRSGDFTGVGAFLCVMHILAPTMTSDPFTAWSTVARSTAGGQIAISLWVRSLTRGRKVCRKFCASVGVLYIFQLAAIRSLRMLLDSQWFSRFLRSLTRL